MAILTHPDLAAFLDAEYCPAGHRLGILVAPLTSPPDANVARRRALIATALQSGVWRRSIAAAARAIEAHGMSADRRLCCLQPRPGEPHARAADVVDFLERYGHEYSVMLLDVDAPEVIAASIGVGCAARVITGVDQ